MKLDTDGVWLISKAHLSILKAAEHLLKSCSVIPVQTLKSKFMHSNFNDYILDLCKLKFISYVGNGYKLTISGCDCLAINEFRARGLNHMGERIGIGKESDIYIGKYNNKDVILKFHRLGRTCFRSVRKNRDYTKNKLDWLSLNRVSCKREVEYLSLFADMCIPKLVDSNRHVLILEMLDYAPLYQTRVKNPGVIYGLMVQFIKDLWYRGYVHGDFNEFNVMVKDDIRVIDFPQCIKNTDERAVFYLRRDFESVTLFFEKKYRFNFPESAFEDFAKEINVA